MEILEKGFWSDLRRTFTSMVNADRAQEWLLKAARKVVFHRMEDGKWVIEYYPNDRGDLIPAETVAMCYEEELPWNAGKILTICRYDSERRLIDMSTDAMRT